MNRILVNIVLQQNAIATIKANPQIAEQEMSYINKWKNEALLESFFITTDKTGAVLIFQSDDEAAVKNLIEILPYFPYMARVDYLRLNKNF